MNTLTRDQDVYINIINLVGNVVYLNLLAFQQTSLFWSLPHVHVACLHSGWSLKHRELLLFLWTNSRKTINLFFILKALHQIQWQKQFTDFFNFLDSVYNVQYRSFFFITRKILWVENFLSWTNSQELFHNSFSQQTYLKDTFKRIGNESVLFKWRFALLLILRTDAIDGNIKEEHFTWSEDSQFFWSNFKIICQHIKIVDISSEQTLWRCFIRSVHWINRKLYDNITTFFRLKITHVYFCTKRFLHVKTFLVYDGFCSAFLQWKR